MPTVTILGRTFEVSGAANDILVRPVAELMNHVLRYLTPSSAALLLEIYETTAGGGRWTVPPGFVRHGPDHRRYRELRHSLLVMPRDGGQWEPGTEVVVCVLAHMLYAHAAAELRARAAGSGWVPATDGST